MTVQCTLFLIGGFVSGTFVGIFSIAGVSRFKVAVADDVLASLIEMRAMLPDSEGSVTIKRKDWNAVLARADIAIFNATEQPCPRKSN
jgi:hypothetical protein